MSTDDSLVTEEELDLAHALDGFATGKRKYRNQSIYTPRNVLRIVEETFGRIELDPCAAPDHDIGATQNYVYPEQDGLVLPWTNATYCNPPFGQLKPWLLKSRLEFKRGAREQLLLFPVRPRARWWCDYVIDVPSAIAWLKRVKFVGYNTSYPEALVLVYTGVCVDAFRGAVTRSQIANLISGPWVEQ